MLYLLNIYVWNLYGFAIIYIIIRVLKYVYEFPIMCICRSNLCSCEWGNLTKMERRLPYLACMPLSHQPNKNMGHPIQLLSHQPNKNIGSPHPMNQTRTWIIPSLKT
uniref:Uncharacterized protein n=1 Tax=Arundo donax TaxID=35708 RepID=A0A0A9AT14_ARUDO